MSGTMNGRDEDDEDKDDNQGPYTPMTGSMVDSLLPDDEGDEFEIVETDDDFKPVEQAAPQETAPSKPAQQTAADDDDAPRDTDDDEIARKRRDRAAERRRRKEGRERTFAENAQLREQVRKLEEQLTSVVPRITKLDQERIQDQIAQTEREMEATATRVAMAKRKMAEATQTGDADALTAALDDWEAAKQRGMELAQHKQRLSTSVQTTPSDPAPDAPPRQQQQAQPQPQQQQPPRAQLSETALQKVRNFHATHDWMKLDAQGRPADFDTKVLLELDAQIASEGFDPEDQDYWDELDARGRQYLPKYFNGGGRVSNNQQRVNNQQQHVADQRRGPKVSGSSERPTNTSNNKVYLSPQRKQALVDAGVLDNSGKNVLDKQLYTRYMRSYQKWDRENGRNN